MEHVWNYEGYVGDVRAVDVAVRRLREKLEDDPAAPKFILTSGGWAICSAASRADLGRAGQRRRCQCGQ